MQLKNVALERNCDELRLKLTANTEAAEAQASADKLVQDEMKGELDRLIKEKERNPAVKRNPTTQPSMPTAELQTLNESLLSLTSKLETIHADIIDLKAQPLKETHQTLILWDIENVGVPLGLSGREVTDVYRIIN